jgi:hypothetical protein
MMMRVWKPLGLRDAQYSYLGRWIKDVDGGQWRLYGIVRLPEPATSFTGNAGFLEDFGNNGRSVRSMYRRLGYYRKAGKWRKSDTVTYDVPAKRGEMDTYWVVNKQQEGDHEVLQMELSSNRTLLPQKLHGETLELGKKHAFTVNQPSAPHLDPPRVRNVRAVSNGKQVVVTWSIPASAAPQFAFRVEIFDNRACTGRPTVVREERMPTINSVLLNARLASPTVRLTITDVFDQTGAPVIVESSRAASPSRPVKTAAVPGLEYTLLTHDTSRHINVLYPNGEKTEQSRDERHNWLSIPEMHSAIAIQSGIARGFDTDLRVARTSAYGFRFRGLLRAPDDGTYVLHMRGSDGYSIRIDGRDSLVWDGLHGPQEKTAVLELARGDHLLGVDYFVDQSPAPYFNLEWEGPGFSLCEVPSTALLHTNTIPLPVVHVVVSTGTDGTATATISIEPNGHSITRTQVFLDKLQIAEGGGLKFVRTSLMREGTNSLWVRGVYDNNHTIDSEPTKVLVAGEKIRGWNFAIAGEAKARRGVWQSGADAFSFIGEGEYVISRPVKGDFTLTCCINSYTGSQGEPANASSWVGLTAREDASKSNYAWGREFGIMQTAGYGLRTTPNFSDLGGGRISDYALSASRPWVRIVRSGNQWTAWSSPDGMAWRHETTHYIPTRPEMDAGLVFRALPQDARSYFQARVSHLMLESGVAREVVMPAPIPATNTNGPRLTGVVIAPSDPNVTVVRSTNRGLIRSSDGGKTWRPANGSLSGFANCVRSVAIHPTDPMVMVRAFGSTRRTNSIDGGLALTHDGGKTWQILDFPGDFDGEGPSALCGEVVAFDPINPQVIFAGCESMGFFRSGDSGKTWKLIGAAGDRITAITVNRWVRAAEGKALLHVVTCPDGWMTLLGRGTPSITAGAVLARDYISRDGGSSLQLVCERTDLGYLNAAFDKGAPDELPYATSHGILKALSDGERTFLFPEAKNLDVFRPVTAIGCTGIDDGRAGRCLTQPLDPLIQGRLSHSDFFAFNWDWRTIAGLSGGMIAISGEFSQGKLWWMLTTNGLYVSHDGGAAVSKVLDERGIAPASSTL